MTSSRPKAYALLALLFLFGVYSAFGVSDIIKNGVIEMNATGFRFVNTTGSNHFSIDGATGYVGMGTSAPDVNFVINLTSGAGGQKLVDVDGNLLVYGRDGSSGTTSNGLLSVYGDGNVETIRFYGYSAGDSWFNGGNLGVGTTTPTQKLTVAGSVNVTTSGNIYLGDNQRIYFGNDNDASIYWNTSHLVIQS
jgi:hypothetical protein